MECFRAFPRKPFLPSLCLVGLALVVTQAWATPTKSGSPSTSGKAHKSGRPRGKQARRTNAGSKSHRTRSGRKKSKIEAPHHKSDKCHKTLVTPFDGKLSLRSAYRSYNPKRFIFCPTWSGFGTVRPGHKFHGGVDISAPTGTPVRAASDGVLTYAYDPSGYGFFARLEVELLAEGKGGSCVRQGKTGIIYAHLQDDPKLNRHRRRVKAGQIIGHVGCSGNAFGMCSPSPESHLHVTVVQQQKGKRKVNPENVLEWPLEHQEGAHRPTGWGQCY
jgi:murein DD-endopeptidase MepM/ murein hydrolase activator NlpD